MSVKQIPILGVILAVLFSPRASELANTAARRAGSGGASHATVKNKVENKKPVVAAKPLTRTTDDCGLSLAADLEKRWWLTKNPNGCSVMLTPAWKEICKLNPTHPGENALLAPGQGEPEFRKLCIGDTGAVGSMMAAVPNPRHTHLGLMTDRAIEAIQVAASEAHYIPLSHYLPWPAPGSSAEKSESGSSPEEDSSEPGVLIFHDGDSRVGDAASTSRPKYLVVFLIPEMPTEGLDREVFLRAGKMINVASPESTVIRFDGPNFSGSMPGLADLQKELLAQRQKNALPADPGQGPCIHAVSGSVTNSPEEFKGKCLTFKAMEMNDAEAMCWFVRGSGAFGYDASEIAILSEEGTQYGMQSPGDRHAQASEPASPPSGCRLDRDEDDKKSDKNATADNKNASNPQKESDSKRQLWFLHFPREISKLRNAYGAEAIKAGSADSGNSNGLGMQWQDAEGPQRDDIQTYGDRQTPLSQEAVLSTLSITLKAKGIKALGVLATDPMDEAFLIYSIKKSSPDVRLFVRDPDLLFLRTPDVGSLNGTLLVSNYPLVPANQFWSSTGETRPDDQATQDQNVNPAKDDGERHIITFPSAYQEGEYNAFVDLLEDGDHNWAPPGSSMRRLEWDWPAERDADKTRAANEHRPLWLAVIGTAGHYPVKVLNWKEKPAQSELHSLDMGKPQFMPMMFWIGVASVGLLHMLGLKYSSAVPSMFKHDFDFSDRKSTVPMVKRFCHMVAIMTIALAQFILGSSYLFFYGSEGYGVLATAVVLVSAVLLAGVANQLHEIYLHYGRLNTSEPEPTPKPDPSASKPEVPVANKIMSPQKMWLTSVGCVTVLVAAGVLWGWKTFGNRFDNAFLHFRDLSLSSGVAATLPLTSLLLVLYFGVWGYLRRLDYWQHRYVEMFNLDLDPVIRQDLKDDVAGIDSCLLGPLENKTWIRVSLLVLAASVVAFRPWSTLEMIEPSSVAAFVRFFFVFALVSIWLNWFRFLNIWVRLRKILDHLENLPLRTAFQRLPRQSALPILQWSSSQNSFLLRQVLERLRALAKADPNEYQNVAANFEASIDALMPKRATALKVVATNVVGGTPLAPGTPPASADPIGAARQAMTNLTVTLSSRLKNEFWNRGSSNGYDENGSDEKGPKAEKQPEDTKYLLAEDIVALPFYAYIRKVMQEMRNILFFLGIAISLLFAALHTYAFRADQAIDWWFFGVFLTMGIGVVAVIAQVERHALVSRLTDKTAGELGGSFYLQLLKYGTVPILTIFGSQIPFISNVVLKWVQPALEALH